VDTRPRGRVVDSKWMINGRNTLSLTAALSTSLKDPTPENQLLLVAVGTNSQAERIGRRIKVLSLDFTGLLRLGYKEEANAGFDQPMMVRVVLLMDRQPPADGAALDPTLVLTSAGTTGRNFCTHQNQVYADRFRIFYDEVHQLETPPTMPYSIVTGSMSMSGSVTGGVEGAIVAGEGEILGEVTGSMTGSGSTSTNIDWWQNGVGKLFKTQIVFSPPVNVVFRGSGTELEDTQSNSFHLLAWQIDADGSKQISFTYEYQFAYVDDM